MKSSFQAHVLKTAHLSIMKHLLIIIDLNSVFTNNYDVINYTPIYT